MDSKSGTEPWGWGEGCPLQEARLSYPILLSGARILSQNKVVVEQIFTKKTNQLNKMHVSGPYATNVLEGIR